MTDNELFNAARQLHKQVNAFLRRSGKILDDCAGEGCAFCSLLRGSLRAVSEERRIAAHRQARIFEPSMDGYGAAMAVYHAAFPEADIDGAARLHIAHAASPATAWEPPRLTYPFVRDALLGAVKFIQAPGNINRDDAIDECARVIMNLIPQLARFAEGPLMPERNAIAAKCLYCMAPGFLYRHSDGYNISMCDKCRDVGEKDVAATERTS